MISILLITILAISLAAAAGFGMLTLIQTSDLAMTVQRNQIRVDAVAAALAANVSVAPDGRVRTPIGLVGDDLARMTSGVAVPRIAPFRSTSWGLPIVWCPASYATEGNAAPATGRTTVGDYDVEVDGSETGKGADGTGLIYSLGGHPAFAAPEGDMAEDYRKLERADIDRMGAVGFLVSPAPTATAETPVLCSDIYITETGEHLSAKEGTVTAVLGLAASSPLRLGQATVVTLLPNGTSGTAPAVDGVVRSLDEAISLAARYNTTALDIRLRPGTHTVSSDALDTLFGLSASKRVSIRGEREDGSATTAGEVTVGVRSASAPAGGALLLELSGDARIEGLTLAGITQGGFDVGIGAAPSGTVTTRDARVGLVRARGGKVFLDTGTSVGSSASASPSSYPVEGLGGDVVVAAGVEIASAAAPAGVRMSGGDLTLLGQARVTVAAGGRAFVTDQGARVLPAFSPATVVLNGAPAAAVSSSSTYGSGADTVLVNGLAAQRKLRASETTRCANGSANCSAPCPGESVVAWGECGSANGGALSSFGASADGRSWSCSWSLPAMVQAPSAKVVCETLPWAAPAAGQ